MQFTFSDYDIDKDKTKVVFLKYVPVFVGVDLKHYGPYTKGKIGIIPNIHAINLEKKGAVKCVGKNMS